MTIEQADDPAAAQYVRMALLTEKTMEIDLPLAPDVVDICRKELRRFCANPNLNYKCSILKTTSVLIRYAFHRHNYCSSWDLVEDRGSCLEYELQLTFICFQIGIAYLR